MSKRWAVCALLVAAVAASAGTMEDNLERLLATKSPGEVVSALVYLKDAVNIRELDGFMEQQRMPLRDRCELVITTLQSTAKRTQGALLEELARLQSAGQVASFEAFWIDNIIRVDAPGSVLRTLAARPDVEQVYINYPIEPIIERNSSPALEGADAPEIGLVAIRAPEVWQMGIDGTGVLTATMDTGVAGTHPALASRWAGTLPEYAGHPEWAWHDALGNPPSTFPTDTNSHGTHTMGTVCGGAPGDQIGVAPGAHWITDNTINQGVSQEFYADVLRGFEWFANPDGNPATNWDVPTACSHSWGLADSHGEPDCAPRFWQAIDACEAVGIVMIFSAGNEGTQGLRRPADRATDEYRSLAVAAVDARNASWPVASFSSRGPTYCTPGGTAAIKPEISAPGVAVRSSVPGGGYGNKDGTSMASPHINGVVVLMRQACPSLSVQQIKDIMYNTAFDLGTAGKDNSYGYGMIDAVECVQAAVGSCGPHPPRAYDGTFTTPMNAPVAVTLQASSWNQPPPVLTYIVVSLPAHGTLADPGAGLIQSVPYTLVNNGNQVEYRPYAYYVGADSFEFKANDGGQPPQGGDSNIATISGTIEPVLQAIIRLPLDTDPGWTKQGQWAFGRPMGGAGDHGGPDPTAGYTGQNVFGYNNGTPNGGYVNSMPEYHLTSTAFDLTNYESIQLRYWRWLGVETSEYDHAYIRVSTNGTSWTTVWENPSSTLDERAWSQHTVNLPATVNHQPTVYLRWTMGTTDAGWTYCGWNIDDIEIWGTQPISVTLGDLNCDGVVNLDDINPFVLLLNDPAGWHAAYPNCNMLNGDINADGVVDFWDINPFVALLGQ